MPAYKTTLADAKASELADISGACPNSARFVSLLNQAQRKLMRRGSWFGTEQKVKFCVYDGCLTLPAYVATLTGLRGGDCADVARIFNHWYSQDMPWGNFNGQVVPVESGMAPTFNTIANPLGSKLRYHVVKRADVGKTITIYGTAYGGQPLQELVDGVWRDGITITAAAPFGQSSVLVAPGGAGITSIVREATQGMSYLYEVFDEGAGTLRALGNYSPNETNPRYRQYQLENFCCEGGCEDVYGRHITALNAMVKLAWVPLINEWDFLLIDNFDALKLMIQSIKFLEANDVNQGLVFEKMAVAEMQHDDSTFQPDDQLTISVQTSPGVRNLM
ncbi:MAG: hypothetical protein ACOYD4_03910 [Solirubrobacterales bacterium]